MPIGIRPFFGALAAALLLASPLQAATYSPGASDKEIKIGQTMPYSGPASAYGSIGKVEAAYFEMLNKEKGGIKGRKITLLSLDDGYSPAKTVEQTRRLIEQDRVLMLFQSLGTASNAAIQKYMNQRKIPQLFIASGASQWGDPKNFPWSMGWQPNNQTEGKIYAKYILQNLPNAKIGILYQNDDYGTDYVKGFTEGLGDKAKSMIVKQVSYEPSDPTVDSQIVDLKSSGADVFFNVTIPKFAALAIRKAYDIDWRPTQFLNTISISVGAVMQPAGVEKGKGIISLQYYKDPSDKRWQNDADYKEWLAFMQKYNPGASVNDSLNVYGYMAAKTLEQVLIQCGDDLTRENVMKQAANLKNLKVPMLLPGIEVNTGPDNYFPLQQGQLIKFNGAEWDPFGQVVSIDGKS